MHLQKALFLTIEMQDLNNLGTGRNEIMNLELNLKMVKI